MTGPGLRIDGIRKRYGGTVALDDFHLDVAPGEIRGLIGENGSGKSTAMKILSGEVAPDRGTVEVDGVSLPNLDPTARLRAGVGVVMQDPHLCEELSVAENLALGRTGRRGRVSWKRLHAEARDVLESAGLDLDTTARVASLSQDDKHMVEVARVLAWNCSVIGFDETTASLTEDFVDRLFRIMRTLRDAGAAQVLISHRLPEIMSVCDTVTVLRDGRVVDTVRVAETTEARLIEMMVGRNVSDAYRRAPVATTEVVATLEAVRPAANRGRVDLTLRAGEVVGIGGLVGSGRSEILESVYGLQPRSGTVRIGDRTVRPGDPRAAIAAGMGLVPEDRRTRGVAMEQSVRANATMVMDGARPLWHRTNTAEQNRILDTLHQRMKLKAADDSLPIRTLSGGNQQKVVLGRWLTHRPRLLLLDEPTRGIDIGAKLEIYTLIEELAAEGTAILLVSSELPELTGLCDRILMMHEGAPVGEFDRTATELELLTAASGHSA